jgi:class 3 adenylate cyclase
MGETRKLAAILVADIVGYSRLAGVDEERTLARLRGLRGDLMTRPSPRTAGASSSAWATAASLNSEA